MTGEVRMKAVKAGGKFRNFCVGIGIAGMASIGAVTGAQAPGGCTGACAQCGTCCLGVLSLGLWLAEKRWRPVARTCRAMALRLSAHSGPDAGFEGKELLK
jgi:hypothetical protein